MYLCETRINALIEELVKFTENTNNTVNKNIVLIVPNDAMTQYKIITKIIELSNGMIKKISFNKLELNSHLIYLVCPYSIVEGFSENPLNIGVVVLNGFYYHMYLSNLWIEEILYILSKFYSSEIFVLNDNFQTFIKENTFIEKIFDELKIC